jgi:hypothetical protein
MNSTSSQGIGPHQNIFSILIVLLFCGAASSSLIHINSSLWLDETVTAWVVSSDWQQLLHRSIHFQTSPVYYIFPWIMTKMMGSWQDFSRLFIFADIQPFSIRKNYSYQAGYAYE